MVDHMVALVGTDRAPAPSHANEARPPLLRPVRAESRNGASPSVVKVSAPGVEEFAGF